MTDIIWLAQQVIKQKEVDTIAEKNNIDPNQAQDITSSALQLLLATLAKKTKDPEEAASLNKALEEDHDGSLLDYVDDFLKGQKPENIPEKTVNGEGILDHILGNKKENATQLISKKTGVDKQTVIKIVAQLAPVALAMLWKAKKESGADANGISEILGSAVKKQEEKDSGGFMGLVWKFLDKDNDGSYMDDLLEMAMNKLSK